jgi:hypothetical protein
MINIGIGIPFGRRKSGAAIDAQAQAHYNRVIADGGVVPSGLSGVNAFFTTVKSIYGTSDITTAISVGLDAQVLGYKLGAGAGTTLGQAAQKLYSCSGASGDVVQTTAASQPLLLVHEGANYLYSPRVTGNFCSTPSAAANSISGDIDIRVYYQSNTNGIVQTLLMKGDASSYNYAFDFDGNVLRLIFGGFTIVNATATIDPLTLQWYRVTRNSTNGDVIFYTSSDGITYTQLGSTVSTSAGNLPTNSLNLIIGQNTAFANAGSQGKIYRATISNTIGGTPVVDFNPNQYNAATSQTQWTSSTGEVWTINTGTAATGYKGVLIDRNIMQGDGIDDTMITSARFNISQPLTVYNSYKVHNTATANGRYTFSTDIRADHNSPTMTIRVNAGVTYSSSVTKTVNVNSLITEVINGASTTIQNNNGLAATGNAGANGTSNQFLELFKAGATISGNITMSTFILSQSANSAGQRTAIYTYIRSINNNAF